VAPQALKSVRPVADALPNLPNREIRTFSRIHAHQSASETFNTSW